MMTHLGQSGRQPQQYTINPKIDDEVNNNPLHCSCKTRRLQNNFRVCWLLKGVTVGPNVCYANLRMKSFRGPITVTNTKGQRDHLHCIIWSPNVLADPGLRPTFKIIIPSNYWHLFHKWPLDTFDLKEGCNHMSHCVKRAQRWPDGNQAT